MVDIYSFLSFLLFVCWWPVWGCRKRGGPERTAGGRCGSAASDARRERRPWRRRTDTHRRHRDAHKMLRLRAVTNLRVWRKKKKKKNETANDKRRKLPLVHVEAFAQEAHLPQKTPSRQSSRRCASAVHESLRFPCRVQDWNRAALTTECGGYCWVSAPYPRLRPHTPWHHRQDGVNDLHEIHRRISAVRGAGEVRELFFFVLFWGFFPPIIIIFIWHHLCMKCQPVM